MSKDQGMQLEKENLKRDLQDRHIQMIAIGGIIGIGLFLGSASSIRVAGPGLIVSYGLGGLIMFCVMRMLGEIAVEYPVSSSFAGYAREFFGPKIAFLTGWTYWYMWATIAMCEISGAGIYCRFWWPDISQWMVALVCLIIFTCTNLIAVRLYGEFEFWFALIKVVTIIAMLICGGAVILFGVGNGGVAVGISNLWMHGGFFAKGLSGVVMALVMVTFAYSGCEMIGITAGEASNPEVTLKSAINKVFWRILIFYCGSIFVILSIYPWTEIGKIGSPFVLVFKRMGLDGAASVMNAVMMSSALSCLNSGIYTCGRMIYGLGLRREGPAWMAKLNAGQVPVNGILLTMAVVAIGVVMNYFFPGRVFDIISSVASTGCLWAWGVIGLMHLRWRKSLSPERFAKLKFPIPASPLLNYIVLAYVVLVCIGMTMDPDNALALGVFPAWIIILLICYKVFNVEEKTKVITAEAKKMEW